MRALAAPRLSARPGEHAAEPLVQGGENGRLRCAVRVDVRMQCESFRERDDPQGLLADIDALGDLAALCAVVDGPVERVTDRDLRTNLERRVFTPPGLRDTSYPLAQRTIDGPHTRGYTDISFLLPDVPDATRFDITGFSPSEAGASGALVTTAADIARFYRALLQGRLLPPGLLRSMLTDTVPTTGSAPPAVRYGLGVYVYATDCGPAYGHGGTAPGYLTFSLNSRDGREQLVAHTNWSSLTDTGIDEDFWAAFQRGYCDRA